jgi:hypothetical protein
MIEKLCLLDILLETLKIHAEELKELQQRYQ